MNLESLKALLIDVQQGDISIDQAVSRLRRMPFEALEFAKIDHHRALRCGSPEVIYCERKTPVQVAEIFSRLAALGGPVLATRASREQFAAVQAVTPLAQYHEAARCITTAVASGPRSTGTILLLTAGTSDISVIEEARITCEVMGQRTQVINDVGVAGLHRLLAHLEELQAARVVVVAAGMDAALPSVVGGLVAAPVIAVPTSVGHGAHFQGLAPLLSMLNACAAGVAVVNIDGGFSAGYLAAIINQMGEPAA